MGTVAEKYPVGAKVHGRVRNLTDFGAFIELEEGIDGLVHVSDISWGKKIKHPKDVLKKDQEIDAIVTSIDRNGQRLSLSMKDLTPSGWETFVATHRPATSFAARFHDLRTSAFLSNWVKVSKACVTFSELSEERIEKAEEVEDGSGYGFQNPADRHRRSENRTFPLSGRQRRTAGG